MFVSTIIIIHIGRKRRAPNTMLWAILPLFRGLEWLIESFADYSAEILSIEPPFIRIVSPRFVYRTGHINSGARICMEVLTKSSCSPMYSLESLIVDIKCQIVEGNGQIDMENWRHKYTLHEAQDSFYRVAQSYGWIK